MDTFLCRNVEELNKVLRDYLGVQGAFAANADESSADCDKPDFKIVRAAQSQPPDDQEAFEKAALRIINDNENNLCTIDRHVLSNTTHPPQPQPA